MKHRMESEESETRVEIGRDERDTMGLKKNIATGLVRGKNQEHFDVCYMNNMYTHELKSRTSGNLRQSGVS